MRPAEIEAAWRDLRKGKKRSIRRIELAWTGIRNLSDNSISFDRPFTVLCGENGAGKSTLLHRIYHALVPPDRRPEGAFQVKNEEGQVVYCRLELGHGKWGAPRTLVAGESVREFLATESGSLRVSLFDPAVHVPAILGEIKRDANFREVLEPLSAKKYERGERELISYLVGKEYQEIEVFEVDNFRSVGVFPYFRVRVFGATYGVEEMGFGEFSLLLTYWLLSRTNDGSIVLLEEPETFVTPRSQRRLMAVAADLAVSKDLVIVATSHSPSIVSQFLRDEVVLVTRAQNKVAIARPAPIATLERRLEIVAGVCRIWLVEDAMAARFARFFLARSGLLGTSAVFISGNNDSVDRFSRSVRHFGELRAKVFGLFDGDERTRRSLDEARQMFLPTDEGPEALLKSHLATLSLDVAASRLNVRIDSLEYALAAAEGEEVHEWVHTLREELEVSLDAVVDGLLSSWALENPGDCDEFCRGLAALADA
jgi:energy-coupling factor transporter ATP-binding protein EcfA2